MEMNPNIESTLSIARYLQGKYLKDVEDLFPSATYSLNDLPFEIFVQYCNENGINLKPLAPKGFSQNFEIKRIFFQFPFGEFAKIDFFKLNKNNDAVHSFSELHEGIYHGVYKGMPFVISNMIIYPAGSNSTLHQLLFTPQNQEANKNALLNDFAEYFTSKIMKDRPFQIDNITPYLFKKTKWEDMFGHDDRLAEYRSFFETRLRPNKQLLSLYEEVLPSLTLIGPTGCGKSFLLQIIMTEYSDFKFFIFRPTDELTSMMALDFVERSKKYPKRIYVFLELDTLSETMAGLQVWRSVIEEGVDKDSGHVAMVIATSSFPEILKTAVDYRPDLFGQVFRFDYPNEQNRVEYVKKLIDTKEITEDGWKKIINETDGFSFAWLNEVVRQTKFAIVNDKKLAIEKSVLESIREIKSRMNAIKDKFPQNGIGRKFGFTK